MVVETKDVAHFLGDKFIRASADEILYLISTRHFFIDRAVAEVSPQYKQIIPYVIIRCGDDYFVLERTAKQTEARLHHKLSLGIGGHINPGHSLLEGLQKELDEEVAIATTYDMEFIGVVNDDTTDVGRVHLGAAYVLETAAKDVTVKETDKMSGQWMSRTALREKRAAMESWSQIIYDALIA